MHKTIIINAVNFFQFLKRLIKFTKFKTLVFRALSIFDAKMGYNAEATTTAHANYTCSICICSTLLHLWQQHMSTTHLQYSICMHSTSPSPAPRPQHTPTTHATSASAAPEPMAPAPMAPAPVNNSLAVYSTVQHLHLSLFLSFFLSVLIADQKTFAEQSSKNPVYLRGAINRENFLLGRRRCIFESSGHFLSFYPLPLRNNLPKNPVYFWGATYREHFLFGRRRCIF